MEKSPLVEVPCPVCGSNEHRLLFETRDYALSITEDVFRVRKCLDCGCGYLSPRPAKNDLPLYYSKGYYWSWEGSDTALPWEVVIERRRPQLEAKARWLPAVAKGNLLDIGTQKGEFIWWTRRMGWDAEGVEMDQSVPNPANMPIRYGDFLAMDLPKAGYDCITMWAVLEHVYEPERFVERVSELLRPGGMFIALVTNLHSIQARVFHADDYPRHLTIFTRGSIRRLCQEHGLKVVRMRTGQDIFGGALTGGLVYATKRLLGYSKDDAFREWKQTHDPALFWSTLRGKPSSLICNVSRLDRLLTLPLEVLLDRSGWGFILTFAAVKNR